MLGSQYSPVPASRSMRTVASGMQFPQTGDYVFPAGSSEIPLMSSHSSGRSL